MRNPIRGGPAAWTGALLALSLAAIALADDAVPSAKPLPPAGDERVTLTLDHVPLAKALESFAVEYRLNIVAGPEVSGEVTVNLFDVPVEDALRAILAANGYGFRRSGPFFIVVKLDQLENVPVVDPVESRVVWLDYLRSDDALKLIEPFRSAEGKFVAGSPSEVGLESDAAKAGGNSQAAGEVLLLRDKRSILDEVALALKGLDRRPRQVLVEAVVLEVHLTDDTKLGIDFNTLDGLDFSDLGATSNLNSLLLGPVTNPEHFEDGVQSAGTFGFASDANTDGLHVGLLGNDVAVFIEALERVTDATVLASPRVLAVDRQKAEIIIGAKLGYKSTTTTETATVEDVEFLDVGTQLRFRPFVSSDGFVRFEIHPENSTGVVDPASGLPSETTTEVTTNVIVKDGATIALGGLIGDHVETLTKQVPLLGSIPLIGVLFRETRESIERREIIVLMTPHIVDPEKVDGAALALSDDMASARDLVLRDHLWLSRARLAKPMIESAERSLAEGDFRAAARMSEAALFLLPADVRACRIRRDALALLGEKDREARTLDALEGLR